MRLRAALWCWALASLAGCQFDAFVPPQAHINCQRDADCPRGTACVPGLKLCKATGVQGPVLTASLDHDWAKEGTVVTLSLSADQPLLAPPRVFAILGPSQAELTRDETAADLRYALTVTSAMPEGVVRLVAEAYGQTGVAVQNPSLLPTVTIDLTPPQVDFGASSAAPAIAGLNGVVSLRAVFSEPIVDGATLTLSGGGSATADSNQNGVVGFTYRVTAASPEGPMAVAVAGVFDRAGNPLAGDASLPGFTVDTTAPRLSSPGVQGLRFSANPGHNLLTVPVHVDDPTAEVTVWFGSHSQLAHDGDTVQFQVTTADPEGVDNVVLSAHDQAGNFAAPFGETVTVDFTPPDILGVPLLQLTVPPHCPLTQATALGNGMTASIGFNSTETLGPAPVVAAGPLAFAQLGGGGQVWQFQATVTPAVASGTYPLTAQLEDDVGNSAVRVLTQLQVATAPPAPLTQAQYDGLTYQRIPWGADASSNRPRYSVVGAAGSLPPGHGVVFWSGADTAVSEIIGRGLADPDGSLPRAQLVTVDRTQVYAQHYDGACNAEGPTAVLLHNLETVATLQGKVVGSATPNPHRFGVRTAQLDAGLSTEADPAAVATVAGTSEATRAEAVWQVAMEQITQSGVAAVAYDNDRNRLMAYGNFGGPNFAFDGLQWWKEGTGLPGSGGPAVYDQARHVAVLLIGGRTVESDGGGWSDRGPGPATTAGGGMVYAPDRRLTYALSAGGVEQYDGTSWTHAAGLPPVTAFSAGALAYHQASGQLMVVGGYAQVGASLVTQSAVWVLDGGAWQSGPPMPGPRTGALTAYDPGRQRVVVTSDSSYLNNTTVEYDGTSWASFPGGLSLLQNFQLAYDGTRGLVVQVTYGSHALWLDGGWVPFTVTKPIMPGQYDGEVAFAHDPSRGASVYLTGSATQQNVWELTDAGWALNPLQRPVPRLVSAVGYDPVGKTLIAFSGNQPDGGLATDTWSFDGGSWVALAPASSPSPRSNARAVVDTSQGRLRIFGGCTVPSVSCLGPTNDTWEFTGSTWQAVPTTGAPTPLTVVPLAFDSARGRALALSGGGTWELFQGAWARSAVTTPATYSLADFYDDALGEWVIDDNVYDGTSWKKLSGVLPTVGAPTVYEVSRARAVRLEYWAARMWERKLSATAGPAHLVAVSCSDVLPGGATPVQVTPTFVSGAQSAAGTGAVAEAWVGNQWTTLTVNAAAPSAPAAVTATVADAATLAGLCSAGVMTFAVTSRGGSDYTLAGGSWTGNRAQLTTDYLEVTVRSRLP